MEFVDMARLKARPGFDENSMAATW
jgi:hypothetical protein